MGNNNDLDEIGSSNLLFLFLIQLSQRLAFFAFSRQFHFDTGNGIIINSRHPLLFAFWRFPLFSKGIYSLQFIQLLAISAQLAIIRVPKLPMLKLDKLNLMSTFDFIVSASS